MLYVIADELIGRAVGTTNMFTSMTSAACVGGLFRASGAIIMMVLFT